MNVFHFLRMIDMGIEKDAEDRSITPEVDGNLITVRWRWKHNGKMKCIKHSFARSCFYTNGLRQFEEPIEVAVKQVRDLYYKLEGVKRGRPRMSNDDE